MGSCISNKLDKIDCSQFKDFSYNGTTCYAKVVSVYDGDTVRIIFDDKGVLKQYRIRLYGIDTPEIKPRLNIKNRDQEINKAKKAKEFVAGLILEKVIWIKMLGFDKYGRILGSIYVKKNDEKSISDLLIENKLGMPYFGGTK